MRRRLLLLSFATLTFTSGLARAQAQDNTAAVEALFAEGKRLMTDGNYAAACPKFRASYALEARLGTLLNLANCYEKNGQLASAWARFVEARTLAARAGQAEREQFASEHAAALEPKLSRLTVAVARPAPGLVVKRDGVPIDPGSYGTAVAVDPGPHTIDAEAPGRKPFSMKVDVASNADRRTVEVPGLAEAPRPKEEPQGAGPPGSAGTSKRAIAGIATAGAGIVLMGVGTYFGFAALGKNDDSNAYCNVAGVKNDCTAAGVELRSQAVTDGTLSTVFFGVGGAAFAAGAVLYFTAPSRAKASVAFDGRTVRLGGSF
jgi:hypothetical protein